MNGESEKTILPGARAVAAGVAGFLACLYGGSVWNLVRSTGGMETKFSKVAVDEYLGFLVAQNLLVLVAYVLLGVAAWLLLMPLAVPLARRFRFLRGWKLALAAALAAYLMHGFFKLRLFDSRPYFIGDAEFSSWQYRLLELPPESIRPLFNSLVFEVFPAALGLAALGWWLFRFGRRTALVLCVPAVCALVLAMVPSPVVRPRSEAGAEQAPNVLIIGSDSLRGDRLGYAGYRPRRSDGAAAAGVSPKIDAWAENAAVFELCRTSIASTLESGISVMTSSYPGRHGIRQMFPSREQVEAMRKRTEPLAGLLGGLGYDTAAIGDWCAGFYEVTPLGFEETDVSSFDSFRIYISQAVFMEHFVVPLYFDNALGFRLFPQVRSFAQFVTPEVVTERVESRIARQAESGQPFFWHVFYSLNHLPFRSQDPYCRMFSDPDYSGPNRNGVDFDIDEFIGGTDLEEKWRALPESEARQINALYDGCTRQFDDCFGRILDALERHGLADNTIVVLTADHGDDLYEPGVTLGHGLSFNGADHSYHVPLAISVPGGEGKRIRESVRTIDLAPTLASLTGAGRRASWQGVDLAGWMDGSESPRDLPYFGETQFPFIRFRVEGAERPELPPMDELTRIDPDFGHQFVLKPEFVEPLTDAKQRCMRTRDWKLVATPVVGGGWHRQLFHTAEDPNCERDLASVHPAVLAEMWRSLEFWIREGEEPPEVPFLSADGRE